MRMKHDISFLPEHKQQELNALVKLIREHDTPEMIILFGSYARDAWVEDRYDEKHYRYQSDFDVLIIVETKSEFAQTKIERTLEDIIEQADEFYEAHLFLLDKGKLNTSVFQLHQTAERLCSGILLVFTHYKPATHDIAMLRKLVSTVSKPLGQALPMDTSEQKQLFKLLRKAYVDARYKRSYVITQDELTQLSGFVKHLRDLGEVICQEKIKQLGIGID